MGFYFVKDRYRIKTFATEQLTNGTPAYQLFVKGLTEKGISQRFVLAGDQWHMGDGVEISIAGPTQTLLDSSSPGGTIGETKEFASLVTLVSYGSFRALLTGDSQASGLTQAFAYIDNSVSILQAPHHGSASGLDASLIEKLSPTTAVISVGKNNYGHPTRTTLQLLEDMQLRRTDKEGDIVFVSGGD
jgi:beta-lactamase superfamily II metal-dependent hydrolase